MDKKKKRMKFKSFSELPMGTPQSPADHPVNNLPQGMQMMGLADMTGRPIPNGEQNGGVM
jgi:hypothetical protein